MRLLVDTGESANNWNGYEYIVNRVSPTSDKAYLERSKGGWNWETVAEIDYSLNGNRLQLKIPKSALGIAGNVFNINFKWSDNTLATGDIMDFYLHGDTAPLGRFMYQYKSVK